MKNNFTKILALIIAVLTVLSSMCFVVSADTELVNLYDNSKATTGRPTQMRNFYLRGPAGTGKTAAARAIILSIRSPCA